MQRLTTRIVSLVLPTISIAALMLQATARAQAVGTWSGVRILEPSMVSSSPPGIPVVACDPSGHTVAAWDSPAYGIAFSERYPGGEWSNTTAIMPNVNGFAPQIAIGSSGVVAATWIVPGQEFIPTKLVVSVRPVGGTFTLPVTLASGSYIFDSKLGVVDNGSVTVAWGENGSIKTTTRNPVGAWTPQLVLSASGMNAVLSDLVVNGAGSAIAVWQETVSGGTGPASVTAAIRPAPARSRWGAAQRISSGFGLPTYGPLAGIDASGNVGVGFIEGSAMVVAKKHIGNAWTLPQQVSPMGDSVYATAFAMDADGDSVTAWQKLDASNYGTISKRILPAAGPWGPVTILSTSGQDAAWPTASVARDGSIATITWEDNNTFDAHAAVGPLRGVWTVHTIGQCWWNTSMPLAAGSAAVSVVWPAPTANPNVTRMVANVYTP